MGGNRLRVLFAKLCSALFGDPADNAQGWNSRIIELESRLAALEGRHAAHKSYVTPALWRLHDRLDARLPGHALHTCLACAYSAPQASFEIRISECRFGGTRLERLVCPKCGCIFGPMKFLECGPELIDLDYRLLYSEYTEGDSTDDEIRAFHALSPQKGKLYLNWGSGAWSASVELLRAEGYDVWGYEPHAETASPFVVKSRGEVSARFDGIFSNNVIEHFTDPAAQFEDFRTILKPDGRMSHASPCYEWVADYTRFHVFFPVGDAAARLATRTGFILTNATNDGDFRVRVFDCAHSASAETTTANL